MSRSSCSSDTDSDTDSYDSSDYISRRAAPSLPDEVLNLISSFLPDDFDDRRRNFSRLCLVCRRFYVFFVRAMYRRISIAARDATNRDSPTYRLLTHLAFRPEFRPFIEEVALDFSRCDSYRLWCVSAALRELTSVRAFDIPADFVEIAKGRFWDVGFATRETLRRFTVRSNQAGEFNDWHIERARLLPQGELRLLGGRKSAGVHLSPIFPSDLAILDVEISICPSCFDRLTIDSEETLTHLSILVRADDFDLSALYNLRSLTIMSRAVSISSAGNFFAAVSATLASAAELDHLHAVALTCGSGERSLWPKWISRTPSMPLHTCLPTSLLSLDIADARFDYDDLIPLTNKRNLPSLRRIILSKGTLGSMIWPFDKCEPELIKSTVEGHAANRGVLVEWMAEA